MPNFRDENRDYVMGDRSWYDTLHGLHNNRSIVVQADTFTAGTDYPDGYIPSGTAIAIITGADGVGEGVKYNPAGIDGSEVFAGFLATDQRVFEGEPVINAALYTHGRVRVNRLPGDFEVPARANDASGIIFNA